MSNLLNHLKNTTVIQEPDGITITQGTPQPEPETPDVLQGLPAGLMELLKEDGE